jgi:hypothetical protein
MKVSGKFRVYPLWREDVFKDIARIPEPDRGGIREGSICSVSVNGHTKHLIVRGLVDTLPGGIMLDEITRKALGDMHEGISYNFEIKEAGIWGHIKWACTVADRGSRISAWVGIISLLLGFLGAVLGGIGLWIALHPPAH